MSLAALDRDAAKFAFFIILLKSASPPDTGPYPRTYLHEPTSFLTGSLHPFNPTAPAIEDVLFLIKFSTKPLPPIPPPPPTNCIILSNPPNA